MHWFCKPEIPVRLRVGAPRWYDDLVRRCSKCEEDKDTSDFYKSGAYCKVCTKLYHRGTRKERRDELRRALEDIKKVPCKDCGGRFPSCAMDFDHLEKGSKEHSIAQMVQYGYALETVLAEIAKCEIVCANCHRVRTHKRDGWYISETY